ncbi:hypothetical protein SAMN05216389_107100 [Oceanobacillus limi]|uniref:Uncharacterized protein n=1 Tax=Oceanobacillus limi TaxID=930131 RepID=A0A1I0CV69_9BACI|nr:hypothetical protein [Oceanobacillus limi]SET23702.1 hypothetical protein SAMN05216389_107100 [Oceanobacillus limi]
MLELTFVGKIQSSYLMKCTYNEEYEEYEALFLRPLFKSDKEWHLIEVKRVYEGNLRFEVKLSNDHLKRLTKKAMLEINDAFESNRFISFNNRSTFIDNLNGEECLPMYHLVAKESQEFIETYLKFYCENYLNRELNNALPVDVIFNRESASIRFQLPFAEFPPSIHINTVLKNWNNSKEFIDEILSSLNNFFPSKNKTFFN